MYHCSLHREPIQESRDITNAPISTLTERVDRRGTPPPIKTEAPRQTGPESRVTGRETPVPPASRRWVPPSLLPQYGLTEEAQNDAIFRKVCTFFFGIKTYILCVFQQVNNDAHYVVGFFFFSTS